MPAYDVRNLWITAQIRIYHPDSITVNKEMYMYGLFDSAVQLQGSVPHSFQATKEEVNGDEIIRSDFDTTRGSQNRYRFYVLKEADSSGEDAASAVGGGSSASPTNGAGTVMSENDIIAAWYAARPSRLAARALPAAPAVAQAMGGAGGPSPVGGGSSATAATATFNEDPSNPTAIASTAAPTASTSSAVPLANSEDPTVNSTNVDKSTGSKPPSRKTRRHRRKRHNRRSSRRKSHRTSR